MSPPRRIIIITILSFLVILVIFHKSSNSTWREHAQGMAQVAGLGESYQEWLNRDSKKPPKSRPSPVPAPNPTPSPSSSASDYDTEIEDEPDEVEEEEEEKNWKEYFVPGITKSPNETYSRILVIPRTKKEDISWMDEHIPDVERVVYIADDPTAPLHPPANKGHEAMVYLTYIIDNYDKLADVTIFMHAHQKTWHNNDVFNSDAGEMIRRLSSERVIREGYFNMRCNWFPGCPDWMHPGNVDYDAQKSEQILIAKAWVEIFPFDPVPDVLAQPCCSQFALSRERIHSVPKAQFEFYRKWILNTPLKDFISGRVWEYMWQYAFTGKNYYCPAEHVCYCDGYGACFGGKSQYEAWDELKKKRDHYNLKLLKWQQQQKKIEDLIADGKQEEADNESYHPEEGKDQEWWGEIQKYQGLMDQTTAEALERGKNPEARAFEAGRAWKEGDGF